MAANLDINNFGQYSNASLYRYSAGNSGAVVSSPLTLDQTAAITLPAYSISLLVIGAHQP